MSRWLVTGAGGMLGRDLVSALECRRETVRGLTREHLDITDEPAVRKAVQAWTMNVVGQILALMGSHPPPGIYHATSSGETTWFELAREVFRLLGADPARVRRTTSSQYQRPAPRPAYSVLGHQAWAAVGIEPIGDWRLALERAFPVLSAA